MDDSPRDAYPLTYDQAESSVLDQNTWPSLDLITRVLTAALRSAPQRSVNGGGDAQRRTKVIGNLKSMGRGVPPPHLLTRLPAKRDLACRSTPA